MNLRESRRRQREHPDMEMTPLIDVVFLLLIFFVVTTSFSQASGGQGRESEIDVELPKAATGRAASENRQIVLYVTDEGGIEVRGDIEVEGDGVREKLDALHESHPDVRISLKGDERASHGRMVQVLDDIRRAGFSNVNLVARQAGEPSE